MHYSTGINDFTLNPFRPETALILKEKIAESF